MTFALFCALMGVTSLLAWGGWAYVIFLIDPYEAGAPGLALFYITLFAALIGTFSLLGLLYRIKWLGRSQVLLREVMVAVRHGVMFAAVSVVSLALASQNLLTWWNVLALFIVTAVVEYGFLLVQEGRRQ